MKLTKAIISVLLVAGMLTMLCACGSKKEEPAPAGSASAEVTPAADAGIGLDILIEEDDSMINTYSLLAVNPDANFVDADGNAVADVELNTEGADALINWLLSEEGEELAANYGYDEYGEYLFYGLEGAPVSEAEIPEATDETKEIRISTTTSVNDSGLLGYLLPIFEDEYGYEVEVFSAGTGKAIANAKDGNADLILVHAKAQEEEFVADGFARMENTNSSPAVICPEPTPRNSPSGRKSLESPKIPPPLRITRTGISLPTPVWASA